MFKKTLQIIFIALFLAVITVPLFFINRKKDVVSYEEHRILAPAPVFISGGRYNPLFPEETQAWIDDNIGFRSFLLMVNANISYRLFKRFPESTAMYLGPSGELNYLLPENFRDYQHLNIYPEDYMDKYAESLISIKDHISSKGAAFYIYQCWDKSSVYPEYFPAHVNQYGDRSKTDVLIEHISRYPELDVISPKDELIRQKPLFNTYSRWGDPNHWTRRGSRIGYEMLMNGINEDFNGNYRILTDDDFKITEKDVGYTLFNTIHQPDEEEVFKLIDKNAVRTDEKLSGSFDNFRNKFFTNEKADNTTRILLFSDSYFHDYLTQDIAESFYETIFIWNDHLPEMKMLIDEYDPDIVIYESAEREDRTSIIIQAAKAFK